MSKSCVKWRLRWRLPSHSYTTSASLCTEFDDHANFQKRLRTSDMLVWPDMTHSNFPIEAT